MKKLLFCLLVFSLVFLVACSGKQEPVDMIVASDLHLLAPALNGDGSFFSAPAPELDGKVIHYSNEIADAFFAEVTEKQPEVLILSGDLTLNGAVESHRVLTEKLRAVQESGVQVLVIPGNHDINGAAASYAGETPVEVETLTSDRWEEFYGEFGLRQAASRDEASCSYVYKLGPKLQLVLLDTNTVQKGFVQDGTLQWLEKELKAAKKKGITVISVTHQNLYAHNPLLSFGYQLYNASALQELLWDYDVTWNLSGHIHVQSMAEGIPHEIASGSLSVSPLQYGQIRYEGGSLEYTTAQTDVAAWAKRNGLSDENLLNFAEYAREFFMEVARLQVRSAFAESQLTETEIGLLADTFAAVNAEYFAGRPVDTAALQEGIALWRKQESSFFLNYIETMLSVKSDNCTIKMG